MRTLKARLHVLPADTSDDLLAFLVQHEGVLGASLDDALTLRVLVAPGVSAPDLAAMIQEAVAPRGVQGAW